MIQTLDTHHQRQLVDERQAALRRSARDGRLRREDRRLIRAHVRARVT